MPAVFTHLDCLKHDPGSEHPETPARLRAILDRLRQEKTVQLREAPAADRTLLLPVHPDPYLSSLEAMSGRGGGVLFLDTILNRSSWAAVLGATGAVAAAVDHATGIVLPRSARRVTMRSPLAAWDSVW